MQLDAFCRSIVEQIGVGVVVVDRHHRVTCWNRFMAVHSGRTAQEVLGRCLYEAFPDLPETWLRAKFNNVFRLGNFSFSAWQQRPHIFAFAPDRPLTSELACMRQNSTFLPIKAEDGEVTHVCLTLYDVTDASVAQELLEESSHRDGLTGAFNRRYLESALARETARVTRYGGELSVILFDLDHFKQINDSCGHLAGDDVLRATSAAVSGKLRASDLLARYGGEEFVVVLPATDLKGARTVAERLRAVLAAHELDFTASFGVADWSSGRTGDYQTLLRQADEALYRAKAGGRNRVVVYDRQECLTG